MCTAATYRTQDFYFGRTLDYEFSYGDEVTVTPRCYPFAFRHMERMDHHYAMIGMAYVPVITRSTTMPSTKKAWAWPV